MATNPESTAADRARAAATARAAKEAKTRRALVAGSLASFVAALGLISLTGTPPTTEAQPAPVAQEIEQPRIAQAAEPKDEQPIIDWNWGEEESHDNSWSGGDSHDEEWGGDSDEGEGNDDDGAWIIGDAPAMPQWGDGQQPSEGSSRRAHARTRSS